MSPQVWTPRKMQATHRAVEQYQPGDKDKEHFTILFAGNAFYRKGGVELLKAFQHLGRKDARLWIVSTLEVDWGHFPSDEDKAWAERTIAEDPRITLWRGLGHADLIQRMRQAHVFVSTTFADPFNNTILEAMGTQLPIIGSQVSSLPEVVQHGRNGWLLPVEDLDSDTIADDLAHRRRQLMDDAELRERMGRASLAVVREKFDLRVRNETIAAVYGKALGDLSA
ncbi:MAG: glycosyltransferase family 4 protein [Flavobacteriales bacterium]|nr:glycosyltransferase family 4 protein [Flavobacteriales bacterium]